MFNLKMIKLNKILRAFLPGIVLILSLAVMFSSITIALADDIPQGDNTFDRPAKAIEDVLYSLVKNLRKLINPLGFIAILSAVIMMFLPGQSAKNVDRLKSVVYATLGAIILINALWGLMELAARVGSNVGSGLK